MSSTRCPSCRATAGTASRGSGARRCWASWRWGRPTGSRSRWPRARPTRRPGRCRRRGSTASRAPRPGHPARDPAAVPQLAAGGARGRRARLGELRMPALVLWGLKDPYIPARFGRDYAEALGVAELARVPRRRALGLARPPGHDRPGRGLPERGVSALRRGRRSARRGGIAARPAPAWTLTAALAVVYLIIAPQSPDLAAASYRSHLFSQVGFSLWDNSWYAGHHLPAYSLLAPALGALHRPPAPGGACRWSPRQRCSRRSSRAASRSGRAHRGAVLRPRRRHQLLSSRVPFDLGLAVGLAALLLAQRGRLHGGSGGERPVKPREPRRRRVPGRRHARLGVGRGAAHPASRAAPGRPATDRPARVAFPEGGTQPFVASAFYPALAGVLVVGFAIPPRAAARCGSAPSSTRSR